MLKHLWPFFLFGVFLFYVWQGVAAVLAGYRLKDLHEKKATLQEQKHLLLLHKREWGSLERIEKIARERFGMSSPDPRRIRIVSLPAPEKGFWEGIAEAAE